LKLLIRQEEKLGKRYSTLLEKTEKDKLYTIEEAIDKLKEMHSVKFDETVELSIKLGIDPKKLQQPIRGSVVFPYGIGKEVKVLVFATGELAEKAKNAGADYVGGNELVEKIKSGWLDFDAVVSTPDMMKIVSPLGKILGPKGLMPNPKTGTVTNNVEEIVKELKKGRIDYKMDKEGNIQIPCGKISFDKEKLVENIIEAIKNVLSVKPSSVKGIYISNMYLSLTMSPSLKLNSTRILQELKIS